MELAGVDQVVKVARVRLCYSRTFFLVAYLRESQEMVFEAHACAFEFLGGVPRRGIYDNLKPAVDAIFVGRERRNNRRFSCQLDVGGADWRDEIISLFRGVSGQPPLRVELFTRR